jgi:hypothetical protein
VGVCTKIWIGIRKFRLNNGLKIGGIDTGCRRMFGEQMDENNVCVASWIL